jgi:hypothetical protein
MVETIKTSDVVSAPFKKTDIQNWEASIRIKRN